MKTVAQVASEMNVSVQTIYRKFNSVKQSGEIGLTEKKSGTLLITAKGEKWLRGMLNNVKQSENVLNTDVKQKNEEIIQFLEETIRELQNELKIERAHSRDMSDQVASLAEKLAELTRNSQIIQHSNSPKMIESADPNEKQSFWSKVFGGARN